MYLLSLYFLSWLWKIIFLILDSKSCMPSSVNSLKSYELMLDLVSLSGANMLLMFAVSKKINTIIQKAEIE